MRSPQLRQPRSLRHLNSSYLLEKGPHSMKRVSIKTKSNRSIDLLSRLLLAPRESASKVAKLETDLVELDKSDFDSLVTLACANHVIIRAIGILRDIASGAGDAVRTAWADEAI